MILSKIKAGCSVGFFGYGKSTAALLSCLPLENCSVTLRSDTLIDRSELPRNVRIDKIYECERAGEKIDEEILFFSPSVRRERPELMEAKGRGVLFLSDFELFLKENTRPIFAVTGSDGKSTTATLIHLLLSAEGINSRLIGNIGEPMMAALYEEAECFVVELSSFMLKYARVGAVRGCITCITPNHLDWHSDFNEYEQTKLSLAKSTDELVISEEITKIDHTYAIISDKTPFFKLKNQRKARLYITLENGYICRNGERLINTEGVTRNEKYNLKNLMMAIAMTDGYVGIDAITSVAKTFAGLAHRCECFIEKKRIKYIDSSIDSTPERTVQTLTSLDRRVVIILGGRSKGLDYSALSGVLKKYAENVIITGENANEIYSAIGIHNAEIIDDFTAAVRRGLRLAQDVGILILSPASTSYDRFKNYAERGEKFKEIVLKSL